MQINISFFQHNVILMQRAVMLEFPTLVLQCHFVAGLRRAESIGETLPDVVDSKGRRMNEIVRIETVVAEFVKEDLVRRKILTIGRLTRYD